MKKIKNIYKYILTVVCLLVFLLTLSTVAYADTASWSYNAASYGPNSGTVETYSINYTYPQSDLLYAYAKYMRYTDSNITAIRNYYDQNTYYPGIDITDVTTDSHLDAWNAWYYTNYPNPKFDTDDDDGNSFHEETEVTCLSPYSIQANYDYYYDVEFKEAYGEYEIPDKSFFGRLEVNTSESYESFYGEYNTVYFNLCEDVTYTTPY